MSIFKTRVNNIAETLQAGQAALITSDVSITYLTGFRHSEGYVVITGDESYFLVDFRYIESVQNTVKDIEVRMFSNPYESINEIIAKHSIDALLIEDSAVTLSQYKIFSDKLNAEVKKNSELSGTISKLRRVKTPDEIAKLKKAQQIAEKSYLEVLNYVKPGVSEREISARLEFFMKMNGAEGVAFDLITVTGKKTSLPHGVPGDEQVQAGDFVTFDIGAVYEGYHSDMTRTIAVGSVSEEQKMIYNIVLEAHLTALESVKAGVTGLDVDKIARTIITNAGYGQYFGHSTGHGVGLEIHEPPFAGPRSTDLLVENMTVTVEPGIYLPDKFGVRIEDTVLVTKDGCESFATLPKKLLII